MNDVAKPRLGIVGAGKVGGVLGRLLYAQGYEISAIYSRSRQSTANLAGLVDASVVGSAGEVIEQSDLTLVAVPDDVIGAVSVDVYQYFAKASRLITLQGKGIVHTSGVQDRSLFSQLADAGMMTGSLHPAFPFAVGESERATLKNAAFAVECNAAPLCHWLLGLVDAFDGRAIRVPEGEKALYHAALVFASNYTVVLYATAERLLLGLGAAPDAAKLVLDTLLAATVDNLQTHGIPNALTGPLVRGDVGTLRLHLAALWAADPALAIAYGDLARLGLPLLAQRGVDLDLMEQFLQQEQAHAADHS